MSQAAGLTTSVVASAASSEESAAPSFLSTTLSSVPTPAPKLRSCVVCRTRKVRCDKRSPCSNCRRAKIACVFPSTDHSPRWARHMYRLSDAAAASDTVVPQDADPGPDKVIDKVMARLQNLEDLVKELRGQLEQAHAAASSAGGGSSGVNSPGSSTQTRDLEHQDYPAPVSHATSVNKQLGRLVVQDSSRSRYVSGGFWSRIEDELEGLKGDADGWVGDESDSSEDKASPGKTSSTRSFAPPPSERYTFLFRHNLSASAPDLREFHPLPSQIPFLLDIFSENINLFIRIVHMPTITKMARDLRGSGMTRLTPSNEAIMFSIYYAAVTSMEEDDIMANFGSSKSDLSLKYRLGLEHALAKADFLNAPNIVLVQAFALYLCLARRHDSPRFVWMMTGLAIRMAQFLGLHRDGARFEHLTPFEIEMRRKVWWVICMLDARASEDQGTDLAIMSGSFDTQIPLNINDADIDPKSKQIPTERYGVTDMSFARISAGVTDIMRQIMTSGIQRGVADLEEQNRLLNKIYQSFEQEYLQYMKESVDIVYWVAVTVARLVLSKMTLLVFLPVLFSSPSKQVSDEIRTKLLSSAIQVAEYNHMLNAEQACRHWRWVYQTHTHWYAIVYLMIETSRRPWSPIIERAWVALHSSWLMPARTPTDKNLRIWVPLRKLMHKARQHRDTELSRLRADPQAAAELDSEDQVMPSPSSSGPFGTGFSHDNFRERWRQLVAIPDGPVAGTQTSSGIPSADFADAPIQQTYASQPTTRFSPANSPSHTSPNIPFEMNYPGMERQQGAQSREGIDIRGLGPVVMTEAPTELALRQTLGPPSDPVITVPTDWSQGCDLEPGVCPWPWADTHHSLDLFSNLDADIIDVDMDVDGEMNWYSWVESAKGMEYDARA